mgnify:CR=1 FL=1
MPRNDHGPVLLVQHGAVAFDELTFATWRAENPEGRVLAPVAATLEARVRAWRAARDLAAAGAEEGRTIQVRRAGKRGRKQRTGRKGRESVLLGRRHRRRGLRVLCK